MNQTTSRLKPLGLMHILDRTGESLNRIDRGAFFKSFDLAHAVQHFYEPFLEAFDPALRKEMGVWYTPPELVKYIVARVDATLRNEMDIPDGLADKNVYVLDPCCGTGAFVVEVLRSIEETLRAKGDDSLIGQDVKDAARDRVFGFEIMSAPFVIAHWQVANLLAGAKLNAPFDPAKDERPSIYLTNALTGWNPPAGVKSSIPLFPELQKERDQAEHVKRDVPILVILGNPPYNAYAGTSPEEEEGLVEPYKVGLVKKWGIKKFNLDELYVRFFRVAERRIVQTGRGLFCYISNFSYLGDPSFVVARERLLSEFDSIWIDCLNGDSRETGKLTPDGNPDPSIFSTPFNREGIQLGTAIGLFVRHEKRHPKVVSRFRNFWGTKKREELLLSLHTTDFETQYSRANPQPWNKHSLRTVNAAASYLSWPRVSELARAIFNGPIERRALAMISMDPEPLKQRMKAYFDPAVSNDQVAAIYPSLMMTGNRIEGPKARKKIQHESKFNADNVVQYPFKPFDVRYCYLDNIRPLFSEPSPDLLRHRSPDNWFLISRDSADKTPEGPPFLASSLVSDYDCISGHARHFPVYLNALHTVNGGPQGAFDLADGQRVANLSARARNYLKGLKFADPDKDRISAECLWQHVLAIGFSPRYLADNSEVLAIDWPRVPLPRTRKLLERSADAGKLIAMYLNATRPVPHVTSGSVGEPFLSLGTIRGSDLTIDAAWGRLDKKGKVFPGTGKVSFRDWTIAERKALDLGFASLKIVPSRGFEIFGRAVDIHLNGTTYWTGVPEHAWNFYIGGYQVVKKWLSYREDSVLGRPITKNEARDVTAMVRRLAAIALMSDALDENYCAIRDDILAIEEVE